jgi:hypothetical protein
MKRGWGATVAVLQARTTCASITQSAAAESMHIWSAYHKDKAVFIRPGDMMEGTP